MAAPERQPLIVEMQTVRSDAFLGWLGPELAGTFGPHPAYEPENLGWICRRVERGFIRVDAGKITYPAHMILRFRLESALIEGEFEPPDLPAVWNEGMKALIGIVPPEDVLGCLQDIPWYDSVFGDFPSYSLGAMAVAQLMATVRRAVSGPYAALAAGDLGLLSG
jgi:carboxypeptidase Taq